MLATFRRCFELKWRAANLPRPPTREQLNPFPSPKIVSFSQDFADSGGKADNFLGYRPRKGLSTAIYGYTFEIKILTKLLCPFDL